MTAITADESTAHVITVFRAMTKHITKDCDLTPVARKTVSVIAGAIDMLETIAADGYEHVDV